MAPCLPAYLAYLPLPPSLEALAPFVREHAAGADTGRWKVRYVAPNTGDVVLRLAAASFTCRLISSIACCTHGTGFVPATETFASLTDFAALPQRFPTWPVVREIFTHCLLYAQALNGAGFWCLIHLIILTSSSGFPFYSVYLPTLPHYVRTPAWRAGAYVSTYTRIQHARFVAPCRSCHGFLPFCSAPVPASGFYPPLLHPTSTFSALPQPMRRAL